MQPGTSACVGQHVPGPLNHLSSGVITALRDATQPSNTQGALQRRHLLRKFSVNKKKRERESNREREGTRERRERVRETERWGKWLRMEGIWMRFSKFEVNLLNVG